MDTKARKILSLTAALASLSGGAIAAVTPAVASPGIDEFEALQKGRVPKGEPNVFMPVGSDLLGLIVTKSPDGTVLADHYSHISHSSHSSHHSHYSSR